MTTNVIPITLNQALLQNKIEQNFSDNTSEEDIPEEELSGWPEGWQGGEDEFSDEEGEIAELDFNTVR